MLRHRSGLGQSAMAARLGLSVSYLSQIENDDRPVTRGVGEALARAFPLDWAPPLGDETVASAAAMRQALADPLFESFGPAAQLARAVEQQPALVDRFIALHAAYRQGEERRQIADEAMQSGLADRGRQPWEEVRDWFHSAGNYVGPLDEAAEALAETLGPEPFDERGLEALLARDHGVEVRAAGNTPDTTAMRRFDPARGLLTLDGAMAPQSRRFHLAHQIALLSFADEIARLADTAALASTEARRLLQIGLANYAAGALLMPYLRFRATARHERHDIDRLGRAFGTSFEQTCHRLSTLQRPGALGVPFFFCRVDMAGNITKRHSATRLQFARFGGACPLWIVHEAVAIPDRILVQLAETPDGVRYVSMAKGLVKPSGSYARVPRRFAVALGCEAEHARDFVYAEGIDLEGAATPIGISCRLCPRADCNQRAFPPADRSITIDPDVRDVVPYRVL